MIDLTSPFGRRDNILLLPPIFDGLWSVCYLESPFYLPVPIIGIFRGTLNPSSPANSSSLPLDVPLFKGFATLRY